MKLDAQQRWAQIEMLCGHAVHPAPAVRMTSKYSVTSMTGDGSLSSFDDGSVLSKHGYAHTYRTLQALNSRCR
jgi:hypothetical protein